MWVVKNWVVIRCVYTFFLFSRLKILYSFKNEK